MPNVLATLIEQHALARGATTLHLKANQAVLHAISLDLQERLLANETAFARIHITLVKLDRKAETSAQRVDFFADFMAIQGH